jgi:hypothetical protein
MIVINEEVIENSQKFDEFVFEAVKTLIPDRIKTKLARKSVRKSMLDKYGEKAFLQPDKLKYPVVDPDTGEHHPGLTKAAYIRARQHGKGDIASAARDKMQENVEYMVHLEGHEQPYDIEVLFDVIDVPPPPVEEPEVKEDFRDEEGNIIVSVGDCIRWTDSSGETTTGKIVELNGEHAVVEKSDGETTTVRL